MANLLPQKERGRFELEYRLRLLIVSLLFLMVTFTVGVIFLLPSYFISKSKEESIMRQSDLLKKTITLREGDISVKSLLSTKQKINQLILIQKHTPQIEIMRAIIRNINSGVTVNAFYYIREKDTEGEIKITGKANSRTKLLSFSNRLKKEGIFKRVDLPVSNLAKDSNIAFSITLNGDF